MYLCFEDEDKRSAFPEASVVSFDENGFVLKTMWSARSGDTTFMKMGAFHGATQNFNQAMGWVKRKPQQPAKPPAPMPPNPKF